MIQWINRKRNKKGFTLIELIVVIAILGILAAIAIPRLSGFQASAAIQTNESNARLLTSAAQLYMANEGVLPTWAAVKTDPIKEVTAPKQYISETVKWNEKDNANKGWVISADGIFTVKPN